MKPQTVKKITGKTPAGWAKFANCIYSTFSWCDIYTGDEHSCKEQASYYLRKNHNHETRSFLGIRIPGVAPDEDALAKINRRIAALGWDYILYPTNYSNVLVLSVSYEDARHMPRNSYMLAYIRLALSDGTNKADLLATSLAKSKEVKRITSIPFNKVEAFGIDIRDLGAYHRIPNGICQYLKAVESARARGIKKVLAYLK